MAESFCVLFDLDGTLIDIEELSMESMRRGAAPYGVEISDARYSARYAGKTWLTAFEDLAAEVGLDAAGQEKLGREILSIYDELLSGEIPLVPGSLQLVRRLQSAGVQIGLVTGSTGPQARDFLTRLGVIDAFGVVLGDGEYPSSKPDPAGYLLAMERLGAAPEHTIIFEDSEAGIAAAKASGATAVAIRHANHFGQDQSAADYSVQDLQQVGASWCQRRVGPGIYGDPTIRTEEHRPRPNLAALTDFARRLADSPRAGLETKIDLSRWLFPVGARLPDGWRPLLAPWGKAHERGVGHYVFFQVSNPGGHWHCHATIDDDGTILSLSARGAKRLPRR